MTELTMKYLFSYPELKEVFQLNKMNKKITTTPERRHWRRSGVFNVNFEQISLIAMVFSLLTCKYQLGK